MDNAPIFITTHNPQRLQVWRKLFRSHRVPVKTAVPRWQYIHNHSVSVLAYDLDAARLLPKQSTRLCAYIARVHKISLESANHMLDGWPIPANQCTVCES
jgi:hypothetical protein